MTQDVDDFQIEVDKIEQPLSLTAVEVLGLMEVHQVFMVSENLYREGGSVEIISPGFQDMDDGKEFSVIDVIVAFCWDE